MNANSARRLGLRVTAFQTVTEDGHPVCVFVCGELRPGARVDTRFVEAIVCGAGRRGKGLRLTGLPFESLKLLCQAAKLPARVLAHEVMLVAAQHELGKSWIRIVNDE